ncbi:MAG TPA: hypothetical protein PLT03_05680 [Bacillota bacterium]|nr:hypothetical protein [Bacillota bacterium]HOA16182.1 hypothetical protein [Bacillota bacterium]HOG53344.1 hypothetical protein [Bacillota bacterium]
MQLGEYLDNIEKKLVRSFDITRGYSLGGVDYDMFAEYHIRNEKYVLSKKAVIYAIESNEYCFLKRFDLIDRAAVSSFTDGIIRSIDEIVKPDTNHMCSMITGVMILDGNQEIGLDDAMGEVRRFRYHKSFSLGFKGWVDFRLLLVSLKGGVIAANKQGKGVIKVYGL